MAVSPSQTAAAPAIAAGLTLTVITLTDIQPVANLYVTIDVPADTPVTTPVVTLIPTTEAPRLHVPPGVTSASVIVDAIQTADGPEIDAGTGYTVTILLTLHV